MADFTCAVCGETFRLTRPDGEALQEAEDIFGPILPEDRRVVCHECWLGMGCDLIGKHQA